MKTGNPDGKDNGPASVVLRFETYNATDTATSKELFDYADALRQIGRIQFAVTIFKMINPETIPLKKRWLFNLNIGQSMMDIGLYVEAESYFRKTTQEIPKSTIPWIYLSSSQVKQERFEDGLKSLKIALESEGDRDEVYLNMAYAHRALGQLEDALYCLKAALSITPEYPEATEALQDITTALALMLP